MRRLKLLTIIACFVSCGGCTLYDAMFDVFGSAYTGGGTTEAERQRDYDDRVRAINETQAD